MASRPQAATTCARRSAASGNSAVVRCRRNRQINTAEDTTSIRMLAPSPPRDRLPASIPTTSDAMPATTLHDTVAHETRSAERTGSMPKRVGRPTLDNLSGRCRVYRS